MPWLGEHKAVEWGNSGHQFFSPMFAIDLMEDDGQMCILQIQSLYLEDGVEANTVLDSSWG